MLTIINMAMVRNFEVIRGKFNVVGICTKEITYSKRYTVAASLAIQPEAFEEKKLNSSQNFLFK
jgi:hypothetical protein